MTDQTETIDEQVIDPGDPFLDEDAAALPEDEGAPPLVNREGEPVEAAATEAAPETETAGDGGDGGDEEPPAAPADAPEPPEATAGAQEAPEAAQGGSEAQEATPVIPESFRAYEALMQTGPNQWTEIPLDGMPGTQTIDGKPYLMARNADHARRQLWPIIGRPEAGATIVAVAKSSWTPKRIRAQQVPTREALEIS